MATMKILQISASCDIGGPGGIVNNLHAILLSLGHLSSVAFSRNVVKNNNHVIRIGGRLDNYLHVAKTRIFDKHGFGSAKATEDFYKKNNRIES